MSRPARAQHYNGDATTTPTRLPFTGACFRLHVANRDATDTVEISFDKGANWYPVLPETTFSESVYCLEVWIRASANTPEYNILVIGG